MEVLSQLETKIDTLLQRNQFLEQENRRLKKEAELGTTSLQADNDRLREELKHEQESKDQVLKRIDGLLRKLSDDSLA